MTTTSYGVLILNEHGQLLLVHTTGQRHWDFPKGSAQGGEAARDAALRAVQELTGFDFSDASLVDLGVVRYLPRRNVHLFKTVASTNQWDISTCRCTRISSHHATGVMTPEVDQFGWVDPADVSRLAARSTISVLQTLPGWDSMGLFVR